MRARGFLNLRTVAGGVRGWRAWACLALLALAGAAAQPPLPPLPTGTAPDLGGTLEVLVDDASPLDVSVDQAAVRTVTVRYTAARQELQGNEDFARDVYLSVALPDDSWSATLTPTAMRLVPGTPEHATLRVTVTSQGSAETLVTVTATSPSRTGIDPPLSDSVEVEGRRADTVTREVLEAVGPAIYALLALVPLVILVLVVLVVRRPGGGVALEVRERTCVVAPGGRGSIQVTTRNLARRRETVHLELSDAAPGWAAILPDPEVLLAGLGAQATQVVLVAPPDAVAGERQRFTLSAYPVADPRRRATVDLEATVSGGAVKGA